MIIILATASILALFYPHPVSIIAGIWGLIVCYVLLEKRNETKID